MRKKKPSAIITAQSTGLGLAIPPDGNWLFALNSASICWQEGATEAAQAELISLAASVPPGDAGLQVQVGNFFLEAQDPRRALAEFRGALAVNKQDSSALAGAGTGGISIRRLPQAANYLAQAIREDPKNQTAAELLETARTIVNIDPFEVWLPGSEKRARTIQNFQQALHRLDECARALGAPAGGG